MTVLERASGSGYCGADGEEGELGEGRPDEGRHIDEPLRYVMHVAAELRREMHDAPCLSHAQRRVDGVDDSE